MKRVFAGRLTRGGLELLEALKKRYPHQTHVQLAEGELPALAYETSQLEESRYAVPEGATMCFACRTDGAVSSKQRVQRNVRFVLLDGEFAVAQIDQDGGLWLDGASVRTAARVPQEDSFSGAALRRLGLP